MKYPQHETLAVAARAALSLLLLAGAAGCDREPRQPLPEMELPGADAAQAAAAQELRFVATLSPMNQHLLEGMPSGQAEVVVDDTTMEIAVDASGLPPGMMHLQHFHGFSDGLTEARCPTSRPTSTAMAWST